ncbi:hypothetical protein V6Z12_A04G189200 [Gossypium hirsutum]
MIKPTASNKTAQWGNREGCLEDKEPTPVGNGCVHIWFSNQLWRICAHFQLKNFIGSHHAFGASSSANYMGFSLPPTILRSF